jgi:acyl carrier protein
MAAELVDTSRIKRVLVRALRLEGMAPESIGDEQPLFGGSGEDALGLDSVDALELVVALEAEFGISIASEEVGRERFAHVRALAELVSERLARPAPEAGHG